MKAAPTPSPPDDASRARDLVSKLAAHDWDAVVATFDDAMRASLPKERLAGTWGSIVERAGAFEGVDGVDVHPHGDARVTVVKMRFEREAFALRILRDPEGTVAGLFAAPAQAEASWQPPPYARPGSFEEKAITIGTAPALPGTWTTPTAGAPYAAVVLVHGSGPNDKDETLGVLKVFKDLAYGLASRGVAVLRYDNRARVDPSGIRTQREEVDDAVHAAVAFAASQPGVDRARVVVLGHSQGGYLAPRIAKDDAAIRGIIVLAGSTRPLEDSLVDQFRYLAALQSSAPPQVREALARAITEVEQFKVDVERPSLQPEDTVRLPASLGGQPLPGAYFLDVRGYHPEAVAAALPIPVLVLQGERDYQVTVAGDFAAWKAALSGKKNATLQTYPALSHAFVAGEGAPSPADYMKPGHVDERVIADIAAWVTAVR